MEKYTLREAINDNPEMEELYKYEYNYKLSNWQSNFRYLDDELEKFWYKIINDDYIPGEYNDIKWYLECFIMLI